MPALVSATNKQLAAAYARQQARQSYLARDNSLLARRLEGITDTYPHLSAATAMALAEGGYDKDSVEVKAVGNLQMKRDSDDGGVWGSFKRNVSRVIDYDKKAVRIGTVALDAPREAIEGTFRAELDHPGFVTPGEVAGQTRLGAAIQVANEIPHLSVADALNNNPSIGRDGDTTALLDRKQSSWFSGPNSLAEKRQVQNARAAGLTDGRATTYGRAAGHLIGLQPGGAAHNVMSRYLHAAQIPGMDDDDIENVLGHVQKYFEGGIDAGATLTPLDPVGYASGKIGTAGKVAKAAGKFAGDTIEVGGLTAKVTNKATGETSEVPILVDGGPRKTVVFRNAHDWLMQSESGDRFAKYAAAETNYERLAHVLGRDTHPQTILNILAENDPTAMKRVLLDEMGKGFIDAQPNLTIADRAAVGQGSKVAGIASATLKRPTARWRQLAPSETVVSRSDPAWAVEQYRRMLHAMRSGAAKDVLTPEYISKNVEDFARGVVDPAADWSVPYKATADALRTALVAHGAKPHHADSITAVWGRQAESQRNFWIDRHSGEAKDAFVTVDGNDAPISSAASSAEMFTDGIPLLNTRDVVKAASRLNRLYQNPGWESLVSMGELVTGLFKFAVLPLRGPAWAIRNVTEAQARVAVEGGSSVFNSPLAALAWRVGDNPTSKASRLLGRTDRNAGRGAIDAAAEDFRLRGELEGEVDRFARAQEHKGGPWNDDRVIYTNQYPITYRNPQTGIAQEGWHEGQRFTLAKLAASPEYRIAVEADNPLHARNAFWNSKIREKMAQQQPQLATREGADAYMDKVYERIDDVTNGNPDLRAAISTGRLNNIPLVTRDARGNLAPNPKVLDEIEKYVDHLPAFTVTPGTVRATQHLDAIGKGAEALERTVFNQLFALFGSVPNNRFVNSPLFRELHWQEAARLAPLADEVSRKTLLVNARKANMPKALIQQFEKVAGPPGSLSVEDVRDLADAKAFNGWLHTVYNSHLKGNWTKSARMVAPFAAAVADMYRFWGKALARNPLILHRVELGLHGARQSGFFYPDENGQERFAYPFTRGWSRLAVGVDEGLSATVKGANMITSGLLPGVGPIVSWPTAWMLPDKPQTDALRDVINPYGDPDASGGLLEGLAPGNVQKILASVGLGTGENRRRRTEAIADTMAYLASTGEYGNSEKEQERLRNDAQRKGGLLFLIQAFAQGALPSSPRAEAMYKDPSGRAIRISAVAADWRKFLREDPDTANTELLKKYGESAFLAVTGGTQGSQFATEESHDLAREHPEVVSRYGDVWSFFTDPNSPYSHEEFLRQIKGSERTVKSLKDRQVSAQTSQAWAMYHQYKDQFGPYPSTDERAYLKTVKTAIEKQYPLWDQSYDVRAAQDRVKQAFAAAKDPAFKDTAVAGAIRAYRAARQSVIDDANSKGLTSSDTGWGKAKATETHRDYLRFVAQSLIDQVPEFQTFWDRVFSDEMVDDVEGQP